MINDTLQQLSDAVDRLCISNAAEAARVLQVLEELDAKMLPALREFDRAQRYLRSNASSTEEFLELNVGLSPEDAAASVRAARAYP